MPSNRLAKEIDNLRKSLNDATHHHFIDADNGDPKIAGAFGVSDRLYLMAKAIEELSKKENGSFEPALSSIVERMDELTHWDSCPWVIDRSECKCDEISKWDSTLGEAPAGCFP